MTNPKASNLNLTTLLTKKARNHLSYDLKNKKWKWKSTHLLGLWLECRMKQGNEAS